jgi:hypothetical protein
MPTGCCGGGSCTCKITTPEDSRVLISGSGQPGDPIVIDVDLVVKGGDNAVFDNEITGNGTEADPFLVSTNFAASAKLDDVPDVNAPAPSNGQVLSWNSTQNRWVPTAPTVAPTGAVQHDASLGGDGSAGNPLRVVVDAAHLMASWPAGVGLTDLGMASVTQHFVDMAARTAGYPAPRQNALSMLDTNFGQIDYWTGTAWAPLPNQTRWSNVGQFLQLSGPWVNGLPATVMIRQVATTTDATGVFDILTAADLTGYAGVLSVNFQETGAVAWKAMAFPNVTKVSATAYRLTDGSLFIGQPITGVVQVILY